MTLSETTAATRHPLTAAIGQTITDAGAGRTYTVTPQDGDTTCWRCGGLVRNWTCYTLARPQVTGPGAYDQRPESAHLLASGLLGDCPGGGS
jgi:hypothetical protein